tara:strand:+ start:8893 stop:10140 length:1248 start_codon:yes stop_codon:yes gene_type:complete
MFCQLNKILTFIFSILIVNISFGQTSLYNNIDFRVDSLINSSISQKAFPGAQVYIKIGEEILTNKSFGYHTYDSIVKVENNHVYDLASLTKVLSSTIALMKLYEDFDLNLNDPVSKYFPELKKSNKKNTTFNEVLSHTSGWTPYINHHYLLKRKKGKLKRSIIRNKKSKRFNLKVSKNLFLRESYHKKIFKRIKKSEVNTPGEYLYSGLFFFYVPRLVEKITSQKYEDYLNGTFYQNIKNNSLGFNPSDYSNVVPTEQDDFFRNTLVHGTVHDEAASLFGGKSGNAGLFGSAQSIGELIKILETWAFNNSNTLLKKSTITKFTEYAIPESNIRRGLGFDKPTREIEKNYPNKNLSEQSFGHTGFTGTFFWTDPKAKFSIVFLTNRVYPTRQNQKLYEKNIRSKLLDIVFENLKND